MVSTIETINSKHLFFIFSSLAIVTLKTFPSIFIELGGRDTWISVVIASVLILLFIWWILSVSKKNGDYNLFNIYSKTLGKTGGVFFSGLFLLTILLTIFESAGAEASVIHASFTLTTPVWVFIAVSAICAVYIVKQGISSVTITIIISVLFISISGMTLALLTQGNKEIKYIFPILENSITGEFVLSILKVLGALSCVSIFIPYLDSVEDKKKLVKHSMIALLFIIQMQIVSMLGVITTFGPDRAKNLIYAKMTQTQLVSAFGFMEAGELFVILQVVGGWFIRYVICFFALMESIRLSGLKIRFKEYYICVLTIVFSYLLSRNLFDMFKFMDHLMYIQLANFFVIPLIVYTICYFKEKRSSDIKGEVMRQGTPTDFVVER